jgi:histidyl-tRNA synthetase
VELIQIPVLENVNLFTRSLGEDTDIVNKEMFMLDLKDSNNTIAVMRPEGTSSVVRALIDANINQGNFGYFIDCFRKERPQKGRYRQFTQLGLECFGRQDIYADINCLCFLIDLLNELNIDYKFIINNIGDKVSRENYSKALENYFSSYYENLSEISKIRFNKKNFLRILDSKESEDMEIIKNAPIIKDFIHETSKNNFEKILLFLNNKKVNYEVNYKLVRGLDYYNDLVFEIIGTAYEASQNALGGGGRYDSLFNIFSNQNVPAIGFGLGVDRLVNYILESSSNFKNIENFKSIAIMNFSHNFNTFIEIQNQLWQNIKIQLVDNNMAKFFNYKNLEIYTHLLIIEANEQIKIKDLKTKEEYLMNITDIKKI